ncbi:dienelactone hydrolase family protein [Roseicella aerolata]|uniref:Dienelactone hydrolase family protein n=1 Tax=Roseicella aerolata TaxID=2883479 RepID=A0A9X1IH92_9PROT|nr:dienelactone hydrolase family protein [Roseicella aerolata]MCB4824811.1 dienelactone hydrolase family protein [Roseicella aerolata]
MMLSSSLAAAALLLGTMLATASGHGHPARAAGGWRLADPWPPAGETLGIHGQPVTFPSSSPFTPRDAPQAEPATAVATLYLPPGSVAGAPPRSVPAVVLLHGAGGVLAAREHTYGRQFAAMGAAALVIDVFGARRDRATGFTERLLEITESMAIADAYAGLRFLARRPEIDPRRVALIGFSYGAMATMFALSADVAERMAPGGERFAAHAAFYGPCIARFAEPRTTGAPLLILYGTGDALIDPARCEEFAADARRGGSAVEVIGYTDALHQWDGGQPRRAIGRLLNRCRLSVQPDGGVRDLRTGLPMSGPLLRRAILALCVDDEPYMIGADEAVRARSNRDLGRFLDPIFADARTTPAAERKPRPGPHD